MPDPATESTSGVEQTGDSVEAFGHGWRASLDPNGLSFRTHHGADALRLRFVGAARETGGTRMVRPVGLAVPALEEQTVHYAWAPGVEETLEVVSAGLKQSFVFAEPLPGAGDLVVRLAVDSALGSAVEQDGQSVTFGAGQPGSIHIDGVLGIDAGDQRCAGTIRYADSGLELRLPAAFVDAASYPLVLDPLIGTRIAIGNDAERDVEADVAFDVSNDVFLVVWTRWAGRDPADPRHIMGQFVDRDGAHRGTAFRIDDPSVGDNFDTAPRVANVNGRDLFFVTWQSASSSTASPAVLGAIVSADGSGIPQRGIIATGNSFADGPDVCGSRVRDLHECVVVYRESIAGILASTITFPSAASFQVSLPGQISDRADARFPRISGSMDRTRRSFVVWQQGSDQAAGRAMNGHMRPISTVVAFGGGSGPLVRRPTVDGDGEQFLIAYEQEEVNSPGNYDCFTLAPRTPTNPGQPWTSPAAVPVQLNLNTANELPEVSILSRSLNRPDSVFVVTQIAGATGSDPTLRTFVLDGDGQRISFENVDSEPVTFGACRVGTPFHGTGSGGGKVLLAYQAWGGGSLWDVFGLTWEPTASKFFAVAGGNFPYDDLGMSAEYAWGYNFQVGWIYVFERSAQAWERAGYIWPINSGTDASLSFANGFFIKADRHISEFLVTLWRARPGQQPERIQQFSVPHSDGVRRNWSRFMAFDGRHMCIASWSPQGGGAIDLFVYNFLDDQLSLHRHIIVNPHPGTNAPNERIGVMVNDGVIAVVTGSNLIMTQIHELHILGLNAHDEWEEEHHPYFLARNLHGYPDLDGDWLALPSTGGPFSIAFLERSARGWIPRAPLPLASLRTPAVDLNDRRLAISRTSSSSGRGLFEIWERDGLAWNLVARGQRDSTLGNERVGLFGEDLACLDIDTLGRHVIQFVGGFFDGPETLVGTSRFPTFEDAAAAALPGDSLRVITDVDVARSDNTTGFVDVLKPLTLLGGHSGNIRLWNAAFPNGVRLNLDTSRYAGNKTWNLRGARFTTAGEALRIDSGTGRVVLEDVRIDQQIPDVLGTSFELARVDAGEVLIQSSRFEAADRGGFQGGEGRGVDALRVDAHRLVVADSRFRGGSAATGLTTDPGFFGDGGAALVANTDDTILVRSRLEEGNGGFRFDNATGRRERQTAPGSSTLGTRSFAFGCDEAPGLPGFNGSVPTGERGTPVPFGRPDAPLHFVGGELGGKAEVYAAPGGNTLAFVIGIDFIDAFPLPFGPLFTLNLDAFFLAPGGSVEFTIPQDPALAGLVLVVQEFADPARAAIPNGNPHWIRVRR